MSFVFLTKFWLNVLIFNFIEIQFFGNKVNMKLWIVDCFGQNTSLKIHLKILVSNDETQDGEIWIVFPI
jgi:hypothetical protein